MPDLILSSSKWRLTAPPLFLLAIVGFVTLPLSLIGADGSGERIYQQLCLRCHGANGEGTDDHYPEALIGDRGIEELARVIAETMPEDDPEKCVGEDARKVAAYIHESFYSPTAQMRNKPLRIELSRLTVRQYQQVVSDLMGSFRPEAARAEEHGLQGEYYKSRRVRRESRVLERIDPVIDFDYGESSPDPEKIDAREFSIQWEGSLLAPETADYEIVIRSNQATRLFLNDLEQPLIDAYVKSGDDDQYRASVRLLAGHRYPLRVEFSKATQGVQKDNNKKPVGKAFISLSWKLPHRVEEVIPSRFLSPASAPPRFVLHAPFPPDDRSMGYERGTSVSRAWDEATTEAALEVAGYVATHLDRLAGTNDKAADREKRIREFCGQLAERAFRRPLTDDQRKFFIDRQFEDASDVETSVKRVVLLVLKSPRFLYREIAGEANDSFNIAARLSFGLWDSLPDAQLWKAAVAGQLKTRDQVEQHAERMLQDDRARAKLREFLLQWLKVDQLPDVSKDPQRFPGFDAAIVTDLQTSLDLFLAEVVWSESSDFRQLLQSDYLYMNGRLAQFYGAELSPDAEFQKVWLNGQQRGGVLSHPFLMAGFAYTATSSPIHRGVFVARSFLGRTLRPPPEAVSPLAPDLHQELTTRERVTLQTRPQTCQTCHAMINPLGFTLENFDAVGRFRDEENGRPVDNSGSYLTRSGDLIKLTGVKDLARFLAESQETHAAFVEQLFHYLVKQPVRAFGPDTLPHLQQSFASNDFHIRRIMVEIVTTAALNMP